MLIILPEPIVTPEYDILSVNVGSYDSFIIRRLHNCFQLALHKLFDSSFQVHSQSFVVLANLDNRDACVQLFQAILTSMKDKDNIFDIGKYFEDLHKNQHNRAGIN
jgi:hypothetical protein